MSNIKCPVCKTGNVEQGKYDKEYFCDNEFCQSYDETDSSTYNILIRTRNALEIAVDALKVYANQENWDFEHFYSLKTYDIAGEALEQITATLDESKITAEQKDK